MALSDEDRELADKIKNDPLAQMHLLLREYGWEAETRFGGEWIWSKPGFDGAVMTKRANGEARWFEIPPEAWAPEDELTSVEELCRRLKEIAENPISRWPPDSPRPSRRSKRPADR
jgi:hypothetical protein